MERVYHAVANVAFAFHAIAEVIGRRLGLPVESREREHYGPLWLVVTIATRWLDVTDTAILTMVG